VVPLLGYLPTIDTDPRLEQGAYITDGIDLYEVTGMQREPVVPGGGTARSLSRTVAACAA
jgi:hypothetical protein